MSQATKKRWVIAKRKGINPVTGKPLKSGKNRTNQAIYLARHEAKKKGLPLPPLPSEKGSNAVQ